MKAYAYIVGPQDKTWSSLFGTATDLGFTGVSSYRGLSQVEQQADETPLCYFLFSGVPNIAELRQVARDIRFSANPAVRFSPMVYCAEDLSVEATIGCINLGFDDVIALPQTEAALRARLERQVGRHVVFYEAAGYFGPDRRNRVSTLPVTGQSGRMGGPFRRLEVMRHVREGISIKRDELFQPFGSGQPMQTLQ
ncbi:hypothetical protein ASG47_09170 [Devosia sp. Leaf420]|uniref:hypothetical protein n=1 Tax=Devosia sp. Leaf420 TaxID=1736374 RepID=UPI000713F620|nr:hypothetical protein [Devosia sp. Leaf420]KQT48504.1 hypothetical protein ASG47_09170 [Devosia sp. Leaf420]